ncbi:MAG: hypothetical protein M0R06_04780 [Sphaerochaeta sp.]|jgi:hypothetical protein|nr:hypothetical protein [Sphaerochaeta sp.]
MARCWRCGLDLKISLPPYMRRPGTYCTCDYPGGLALCPPELTQDEVREARKEARKEREQS